MCSSGGISWKIQILKFTGFETSTCINYVLAIYSFQSKDVHFCMNFITDQEIILNF